MEPNRIVEFYSKKTILITGSSGFLGQVLLEKLLRSCTSLRKIYVILRPGKGKNVQERLLELFSKPIFERIRAEHGSAIFGKVEAVSGDMSAPDLALSPEDKRTLVREVEIVFHSAANVRFEDPLRDMVLLNVRGTKLMLELARAFNSLTVFCHVSTAYFHEELDVLEEKFYPSQMDPHVMIRLAETFDKDALEHISKRLRGPAVNNYTFSKVLAEAIVEKQMNNLPVIVQRPTLVLPAWKEPIPGWAGNMNGHIGVLVGTGKGVIRTLHARDDLIVDALPVDVIVSALIAIVYDYCAHRTLRVYNLTASEEAQRAQVTGKRLIATGRRVIHERAAFTRVLWYPNGSLKRSKLAHYVALLLFQILPALFLDTLFVLVGVKPFLLKVQRKIWRGSKVFEYYANRKWKFVNDNVLTVRSRLNSTEKKMLSCDSDEFDLYEYCADCILAARRFLVKEPEEEMSVALRRMRILRYVDLLCKALIVSGIMWYCFVRFVSPIL